MGLPNYPCYRPLGRVDWAFVLGWRQGPGCFIGHASSLGLTSGPASRGLGLRFRLAPGAWVFYWARLFFRLGEWACESIFQTLSLFKDNICKDNYFFYYFIMSCLFHIRVLVFWNLSCPMSRCVVSLWAMAVFVSVLVLPRVKVLFHHVSPQLYKNIYFILI